MLADVVCILWLLMSVVLGWKRTSKLELPSLLLMASSYVLARIISPFLAEMVDGIAKKGVLAGAAFATILLWPVFYLLLDAIWKSIRPRGQSAEIRIRIDVDGNPIVNHAGMLSRNVGGAVLGLLRGTILYSGILYLLLIIVHSTMYKNGHGTVIVHPKSVSLRWIRQIDPTLSRMDQVNRGLQWLYSIRSRAQLRQMAYRNAKIMALLNSPPLLDLSRNRKLLTSANAAHLGKRDSALLLWIKSYQKTVANDASVRALNRLTALMTR